jgi:F-type H+-transporting ATPase subunit a
VNALESGNVMQPNDLFSINLFGLVFPISDSIVMMWIIMAIIIVLALIFARNLKTIPTGKQNVVEIVVETVNKLIKGNIGHHWRPFAPYFGTILLFLVFANTIGVFNIFPTFEELYKWTGFEFFEKVSHFEIIPPTKDLNITLTMALMTVFLILFSGIRYKGFKGWLGSFLKPTPIMLPFHILDYGTRTLSLSLRLFGNILAGYIIVEMVYSASLAIKPVLPIASAFFDLFDAGLQAYIFVFLSSIYISEAIE